MPQNPPEGMPQFVPYLYYTDVPAAIEWLGKSFGLAPKMSMPGRDGAIIHAEMTLGRGTVMLGSANAQMQTGSPAGLSHVHASLYVFVDDVDVHCERARAAGAKITLDPTDMFWGDRMYAALDGEGHHWTFATHLRDVAPEDMKPPA